MNTFFTADTHFDHARILQHTKRPFSCVGEMNDTIVQNWNNNVSKEDLTYILGDFAFNDHNKWLSRLNGKKVLIIGNHDKMSQDILRNFTSVYNVKQINIDNQLIWLSHYRHYTWPQIHYGCWHLYGHSHGRIPEKIGFQCCDVGVDVWNFTPVCYEVIKKKMTRLGQIKFTYDSIETEEAVKQNKLANANFVKK
jgi:calcineurin-like phosphoesterase family protein